MTTLICVKIKLGVSGWDCCLSAIQFTCRHHVECKEFMNKAGCTAYMEKSLSDLIFCLGNWSRGRSGKKCWTIAQTLSSSLDQTQLLRGRTDMKEWRRKGTVSLEQTIISSSLFLRNKTLIFPMQPETKGASSCNLCCATLDKELIR